MKTFIHYSKFYHYIYFNWVQCNEPSSLALGYFRWLSLIPTKFEVVIEIASSHCSKYKSRTGCCRVCSLVSKILFFNRKMHNFKIFNQILKGWKFVPQTHYIFLILRSKGPIKLKFDWNFENVTYCKSRPARIYMTV